MKKFYHISDTWTRIVELVEPKIIRADNLLDMRDTKPCIAVTPSIIQCILALGAWRDYDKVSVYFTCDDATPCDWVFDYNITHEHRIYTKTLFRVSHMNVNLKELAHKLPYRDTCATDDETILENLRKDNLDLQKIIPSWYQNV